jgi:hypothetical protein
VAGHAGPSARRPARQPVPQHLDGSQAGASGRFPDRRHGPSRSPSRPRRSILPMWRARPLRSAWSS